MDELPVGRGDRATERLSLIGGVPYELRTEGTRLASKICSKNKKMIDCSKGLLA
jgi:hypothetical protein